MTAQVDTNLLQNLGLSNTAPTAKKGTLGQDAFLKLMTTQLQNQDPFKPMDDGNFLAQIAQFSTVSGIQDLQKSFSSFAGSLSSNQGLQATSLIGHSVVTPGDHIDLTDPSSLKGAVDLPSNASDVTVKILDANGQTVRTIQMGPQPQGIMHYQWDGIASDGSQAGAGKYVVQVDAKINGGNVALQNLVEAKVNSVTFGGPSGEMMVSVSGLGDVAFSQVRQVSN